MAGICNRHRWPANEARNGCIECAIEVCDFCRATPVWEYPCADFVTAVMGVSKDGTIKVADPPEVSVGAWVACDPCHDFIEAGDWDGLAEHTLKAEWMDPKLRKPFPNELARQRTKAAVMEFHQAFSAHRHGEARPMPLQ